MKQFKHSLDGFRFWRRRVGTRLMLAFFMLLCPPTFAQDEADTLSQAEAVQRLRDLHEVLLNCAVDPGEREDSRARDLAERAIAFLGGHEALAIPQSRHSTGRFVIAGAIVGPWTNIAANPGRAYTLIELDEDARIEEWIDGDAGWELGTDDEVTRFEGRDLADRMRSSRFQLLRDLLSADRLCVEEPVEGADPSQVRLRGSFADGMTELNSVFRITLEEATGKPVDVHMLLSTDQDPTYLVGQLDDYREVDGIFYPHLISVRLGHFELFRIEIDQIEHDVDVSDDMFHPQR